MLHFDNVSHRMFWPRHIVGITALALWALVVVAAQAHDAEEVEALLAAASPPHGVVFEIASGDPAALDWALPRIQRYVTVLRERFPDLEIAVVTHGREQFALTADRRADRAGVHQQVQRLVRDQDVPVHVCETYAERNGVSAEQFPEYVQVAAAGPAQVRAYRDLGYTLIRLRRP